jgi:hypothetical protein
MAIHVRAGKPEHINGTTAAGGDPQEWSIRVGPTNRLIINNNHASVVLRIYLTEEAMNANEGMDIQPGFGYDYAVEVVRFWTFTASAGSFQALAIARP